MNLADEIESHFVIHDYKWKIGGMLVTPTVEDIQTVINRATELLKSEPEQAQLEIGRLVFKKRQGTVDVFVHFGEVNERNN